jgi:hypothetical protein
MLRATGRDYQEFVHLLDKMLSDNINREFFRNDGLANATALPMVKM